MTSQRHAAAALLASASFCAIGVMPANAQTAPAQTAAPTGQQSAQGASTTAAPTASTVETTQQPAPPAGTNAPPVVNEEEDGEGEEIVVVGRRDPRAVIGDIPPEETLNARDIAAFGATSVSELLTAIAPQTGSSRGRGGGGPVVLLNGKRISGFREISELPPEAILRMEIFPEEVALKYGYRADQRVVNIVLRNRFRSTAARAEGGLSAGGERRTGLADVTRLMIDRSGRTSFNLRAEDSNRVLESERNITFDPATPTSVDPRPFRTLLGNRRLVRGGGTLNRTLFGDVSSTFDGQLEYSENGGLSGPSITRIGDPLERSGNELSGHLGTAFNGQKDRWRWSLTGAYDISRSISESDRENSAPAFFTDRARSVNQTGEVDLVLNGPLVRVPAGLANVTLRSGVEARNLESRASRFGVITRSDLGRRELEGSVNIDVPIARRDDVLSALGNLTLNANAEVEHLSDFGSLLTYGAGFFWSPIDRLSFIGSFTREEGAPSLQQLGNPVIVTPNARIFDFVNGTNATVESLSGGNPDLNSDLRRVLRIGFNTRPIEGTDLQLRADFVRTRTENPIENFPGPTMAVEAAFPERFQRDASGNLVRVDFRPVNFDRSDRSNIRWGFTYSKPLRSASLTPAQRQEINRRRERAGLPPLPQGPGGFGGGGQGGRQGGGQGGFGGGGGRGGGGGGFGGGGFGGGGGQGGRLQLSMFHTVLLKDEVRIRPGLPVLDYLNGEPRRDQGTAQHQIEANAGYLNNGLGAQLAANFQTGSRVVGSRSGNLRFAPLARFNANVFANLGERPELVIKHPVLRGTRIGLAIENIFDARQRVRDDRGSVPVSYQPDYLDAQGRTVKFTIRKLFLPPPGFFRRQGGQGGQGAGGANQEGGRQRGGAATGAPASSGTSGTSSPPAPPTTGPSTTTSPAAPPATSGTPTAN